MPLSGDVAQSINPWTALFSPIGNQLGVIDINMGQSSDPKVEQEVLPDVGTYYGKQIGRIGDALIVLLAHFHPPSPLLKAMLGEVAGVKEKHGRPALYPHGGP